MSDLVQIASHASNLPDGLPMTLIEEPTRHTALAERIHDAGEAVDAARRRRDVVSVEAAQHDLQTAVDAGRAAGMTWGSIGDALGIPRGSAYQRYRPQPVNLGRLVRRSTP